MKTNEFESYQPFLQNFTDAGYEFKTYDNFQHGQDKQVIIRHDVDFDTGLAVEMARLEEKICRATYFIWLTNNFYNILSGETKEDILQIWWCHDVKIHLDVENYYKNMNLGHGINTESIIFSMLFDAGVHTLEPFSIHKPLKKSLHKYLGNVDHTY
ncbi:unnamed protein product, partial [marine sediment metagenome]